MADTFDQQLLKAVVRQIAGNIKCRFRIVFEPSLLREGAVLTNYSGGHIYFGIDDKGLWVVNARRSHQDDYDWRNRTDNWLDACKEYYQIDNPKFDFIEKITSDLIEQLKSEKK